MTNQEIDQIIVRGERKALLRYFLLSQINVNAIIIFAILALLASVFGQFFVAGMVCILLAATAGSSALIKFKDYKRGKRAEFWKQVRKQGLSGEPPTGETRLLIDKITKIQTATPGHELLLMRQAVKLVAAYERQSQQWHKINARLAKLNSTRVELEQKTAQLQALGENHSAGLRSLEQTRANATALQKVADEIQSSCDRLEKILNSVQKTARARQLNHELDRMSALDSPTNQSVEPAFEAESSEAIERQIGREIETYLQLERETEAYLS